MSGTIVRSAKRADWDPVLVDIADYVCDYNVESDLAYETAHYCLMDTLACGFQALDYPACTKLMRPGNVLRARSGTGRIQYRRYESLARL